VYDSYQWYRDGNLIPGATNQYFVVDQFNDGGHYISVEATFNSCTEMSPQALVDGWVFAGLTVMTAGDPFFIDLMGIPHNCPGDTLLLILMQPYVLNIQWFESGNPIPGATDDTLIVTQTGTYTVEGAPAVCPNYISGSIPMYYHFWPVITPVISLQGGTLFCTPSNAAGYQWYLNGNPVAGANSSSYQPATGGNYTVEITDGHNCEHVSAPYQFTVGVEENDQDLLLELYPNPAGDQLNIVSAPWNETVVIVIRDVTGREVMREQPAYQSVITFEVGSLGTGVYLVEFVDENGLRLGAERFVKY
jgi:hypothetical protein